MPLVVPTRPTTCWIRFSAKTPATTSATAPATARAGRSQAIVGASELRSQRPGRQPGDHPPGCPPSDAGVPPGAGSQDRRRRPIPAAAARTLPAPRVSAAEVDRILAAEMDRILLDSDSHRMTTSQPRIMSSLRSSHHCRLSHGSASRARILVKPSPTGSIGSVVECNTRLRTSSQLRSCPVMPLAPGRFRPP